MKRIALSFIVLFGLALAAFTGVQQIINTPAPVAAGGITFDQAVASVCTGSGTSITCSVTVGTGSNTILYVSVGAAGGAANTDTCTFDTSQVPTPIDGASNLGVVSERVYILVAPHTGTHDVVCTTGGSADRVLGAQSWFGVNQSTPCRTDVNTSSGGAASPTAVIVANATPGDVALDTTIVDAAAITVGATIAQVQRYKINNPAGNGYSFGSSSFPATGSTTMNWTYAGTVLWTSIGCALVPA